MQAMDLKRSSVNRGLVALSALGLLTIVVLGLVANGTVERPFSTDGSITTTSTGPVYDQAGHIRRIEQDLEMAPAPAVAPERTGPVFDQAGHIRWVEQDLDPAAGITGTAMSVNPTQSQSQGGTRAGFRRY